MDESGTSASLKDPKFVQHAIIESLREGDYDGVVRVYRTHLGMLNRSHAARAMNVSRQYVYAMLQPANTPSLRIFVAFMRLLRKSVAAV